MPGVGGAVNREVDDGLGIEACAIELEFCFCRAAFDAADTTDSETFGGSGITPDRELAFVENCAPGHNADAPLPGFARLLKARQGHLSDETHQGGGGELFIVQKLHHLSARGEPLYCETADARAPGKQETEEDLPLCVLNGRDWAADGTTVFAGRKGEGALGDFLRCCQAGEQREQYEEFQFHSGQRSKGEYRLDGGDSAGNKIGFRLPLRSDSLYHPPMPNDSSPNRLEFSAEAIPYFVRTILFGLSTLVYVPAAEQLTKLLKFVTSHLQFADGTTVAYGGKPSDVKQELIGVTILIWAQILLGSISEDPLIRIGISIAASLAYGYVSFQLLQAVARNLTTSNGKRLNFAGSLEEYLKWQLMITGCSVVPSLLAYVLQQSGFLGRLTGIALMLLSLVLIAFVMVMYLKWFASKVAGGSRIARFHAEPLQMAGMMIGFVLFSMLIVTIPWSTIWYMKWIFSKYSLPARAAVAADGYSV